MRVRAVTIGWKASWRAGTITNGEEIAGLATQIRGALAGNELELQTVRLATQPFPTIVSPNEVPEFARQLCELAQTVGFDYVSMGPARPHERAWFPGMLEALVREERLFAAIAVTDAGERYRCRLLVTLDRLSRPSPSGLQGALGTCVLRHLPFVHQASRSSQRRITMEDHPHWRLLGKWRMRQSRS